MTTVFKVQRESKIKIIYNDIRNNNLTSHNKLHQKIISSINLGDEHVYDKFHGKIICITIYGHHYSDMICIERFLL